MTDRSQDYITVIPPGLTFPVRTVNQTQPLTITNLTDQRVLFKIKTTAPGQYQVRPTQGVLEPHEALRCIVLLRGAQSEAEMVDQRHRFQILATPVPPGADDDFQAPEHITAYWKAQEASKQNLQQLRLVSMLVVPHGDEPIPNTENVAIVQEAPSMGSISSLTTSASGSAIVTDESEPQPAASAHELPESSQNSTSQINAGKKARNIETFTAEAEAIAAAAVASSSDNIRKIASTPSSGASGEAATPTGSDASQTYEQKYKGMLAYSLLLTQQVKTTESKLDALQSEYDRLRLQDERHRKEITDLSNMLDAARKQAASNAEKDGDKASASFNKEVSQGINPKATGLQREFVLAVWQILVIVLLSFTLGRAFTRCPAPPK